VNVERWKHLASVAKASTQAREPQSTTDSVSTPAQH
jgi:hypothetical protein